MPIPFRLSKETDSVITEVDGLPTETLTVEEFIEVMTGPAGSEVEFLVGWQGDSGWQEEPLLLLRGLLEE